MIKVELKPVNIENIELEISIKMTYGEWHNAMRQMDEKYPTSKIKDAIASCLDEVRNNLEKELKFD